MATQIPKHIAIVMDGNGRWAHERQLDRIEGHRHGIESMKIIIEASAKRGIEVLSVFAFSSENWQRPSAEVEALMSLFLAALSEELDDLHQKGIRLSFIGDLSRFSPELAEKMHESEQKTHANGGLHLIVAVNYGGQWDILQAVRKIAAEIQQGKLAVDAIDIPCFERYLTLQGVPYPDLCIRTSGEQRISNFFLWQLAYSELYFSQVNWPEFRESHFNAALAWYTSRQRRFGKIKEQIKQEVLC